MKRLHKIATIRRLVALAMLCSLLFSSTAVYADTAAEDQTASAEEVVIETGNTSNDTNSSTNHNDTVSGNDITEDSNSNTTMENTDGVADNAAATDDSTQSEGILSFELNTDDDSDEASNDMARLIGESKHLTKKAEAPQNGDDSHEEECRKGNHEYENTGELHTFEWYGTHYHETIYKCKYCSQVDYRDKAQCTFDGDYVYDPSFDVSYDWHGNAYHTLSRACTVCKEQKETQKVKCTYEDAEFKYDPEFEGEYKDGKYVHTETRACTVCNKSKEKRNAECKEKAGSEWKYDEECSKLDKHDKHHVEYNTCETCGQTIKRFVDCDWSEWTIDESYRNIFKRNEHKEVRECKVCHEVDTRYVTCCWDDADWTYDKSNQGKNTDGYHQMIRTCRNEGCGNTQTKLVKCTEFNDWHYAHRADMNFFGTTHVKAHECTVCGQTIEEETDCKWTKLFGHLEFCKECFNVKDDRDVEPEITFSIKDKDGKDLNPADTVVVDKVSRNVYDSTVKVVATIDCETFNNNKNDQFWKDNMKVYLYYNAPEKDEEENVKVVPKKVEMHFSKAADGVATYTYTIEQPELKAITIAGITADYSFVEDYAQNIKDAGSKEPEENKGIRHKDLAGTAKRAIYAVVRNSDPANHIEGYSSEVTGGDNWKMDIANGNKWYSKKHHDNKDLTVTVKATTGNKLNTSSFTLNDLKDEANGIKPDSVDSTAATTAGNWKNEFDDDFYVEYENTATFTVPASKVVNGKETFDGEHEYKLGKSNITEHIFTYTDNTDPTYKAEYLSSATKLNDKYYNKDVEVVFTITDTALSYGDNVSYIEVANSKVAVGSDNVARTTLSKDAVYKVTGRLVDLAGNYTEIKDQAEFVIDQTAPKLSIKFDNHDVKHEKYYKANRTATFTFEDTNIDGKEANMSFVKVNAKEGTATVNEMSGSDGKFSGSITFDKDGIYSIGDLTFADKAGNKFVFGDGHESDYNAEFVIDKTAPVAAVNFDNNSALNGNYFKAARTAEITFTEKNFTNEQVTVNKNSGELNPVPGVQSYSNSGLDNVTHITFDKDGRYGFSVFCEDLAGNISETVVTDDFVIDTTLPELEIKGVENMSANNGRVEPVIVSKDTNLTDACTEISFSGSNRGKVNPNMTKTAGTESFTYTFSDLAHEKANDDLYTLSVKLTDLAGNSVEKQVQYSINRFGSIFVLSDSTKSMIDGYYVTKPQDVVITEINVDSLTKKEVSVAFDGSVKELREGSAYTTSDTTNSKGWHSISYTVSKSNFNKDGIYSVNVYSEDRASNKQSNQSKDTEVEFLLDKTAPSVVVSGLEDGGIYEEDSHDFSVNVADTIGVTEMKVYLNNEKLASYTADELAANGGTAVLTIPTMDDYQKVTIQCSDVAGNVTKLAYNNILVSVKAEELLLEDNLTPTAKLSDVDTAIKAVKNASKTFGIIAVIAIIAVLTGAGVVVYRKRKTN